MSAIYFHTPTTETMVSGTERAWMGCVTNDIGLAIVDAGYIRQLAEWATVDLYGKPPSEIRTDAELTSLARLAFQNATGPLVYQGHSLNTWHLTLNTVMRIGANSFRLVARLHAQCEIHAWVDGPNRAWLAALIDEGLASGAFRDRITDRTTGWSEVTAMLRARDDQPAVTSYSVCDQFPHAGASTWMPAWPEGVPRRWDALPEKDKQERRDRQEAWYDLSTEKQWWYGMEWLRTKNLELTPESFTEVYLFGDCLSWLDLGAYDAESRVRAALKIED